MRGSVQIRLIPQVQLYAQTHFNGLVVALLAPGHIVDGQTALAKDDDLIIACAAGKLAGNDLAQIAQLLALMVPSLIQSR